MAHPCASEIMLSLIVHDYLASCHSCRVRFTHMTGKRSQFWGEVSRAFCLAKLQNLQSAPIRHQPMPMCLHLDGSVKALLVFCCLPMLPRAAQRGIEGDGREESSSDSLSPVRLLPIPASEVIHGLSGGYSG